MKTGNQILFKGLNIMPILSDNDNVVAIRILKSYVKESELPDLQPLVGMPYQQFLEQNDNAKAQNENP